MPAFVKGDVVQLFGLHSRPELNGQRGEVTILKGERIGIKLKDETTVLIKPENLIAGNEWLGVQRRLWDAVEECNLEEVKNVISKGGDPNSTNQLKMTALHRAVKLKNHDCSSVMELVSHLVEVCSADVTAADLTGATVLHYAAASPFDAPVRYLLSKGVVAEPAIGAGNRTPLHYCAMSDCFNQHTFDLLVQAGLDPHAPDSDNNTPEQLLERS
eukprot:TRINITY_DN7888_c0_g1_i1.p1 TRINITY_DN7888_c0_g1~~TRINITY_DN7888_c0_g1_i1.p1  ORF type:complete len:215 (+),score=38.11 TRINITY_DN7888_c0_g1_i1:36-680(+)